MSKPELRTLIRARLRAMTPEERAARSLDICDRLANSALVRGGRTVMAFVPLPGEPDLRPLLSLLIESATRVCLPRIDWTARSMTPAVVESLSDLVQSPGGPPGVLEPSPTAEAVPVVALDAILVPGLAFDARGHRLGRGAGFYDRFLVLPGIRRGVTCGVAFEEQIVQDVPIDPWDVPLHAIATDSRWMET